MKRSFFAVFTMLFASSMLFAANSKLPSGNYMKAGFTPQIIADVSIPVKNNEKFIAKYLVNSFLPNFAVPATVKPLFLKKLTIDGTDIYKYSYSYKGIKVAAFTTVSVKDGEIYRINNSLGKIDFDPKKIIPAAKAIESAKTTILKSRTLLSSKSFSELVVMNYMDSFVPVYKVQFMPLSILDQRIFFVNALTGKVLYSANNIQFADEPAPAPTDEAMVYEFNPLRSPEAKLVTLSGVSPYDDAALAETARGFLTSSKDANEIRKIKAFNCPDKGEKITVPLDGLVGGVPAGTNAYIPFCSPMQLANKIDNGNFIYKNGENLDCETGNEFVKGEMTVEKIDRCAEISMYYHANKIWDYLVSLNAGFDYLAATTKENPLNVIGNGQIPDINVIMQDYRAIMLENNTIPLAPFDNAISIPANPMIDELFKQFGVAGDVLMFFQGSKGDFGFDGDVVYHEFGHSTMSKMGLESMPYPDQYGISNEPGSLHEGLADTFTFIMTGDACTGEYASKAIVDANPGAELGMDKEGDFYCMRHAEHEYKVFEDFIGEVHFDGQPMLAANWAIYNYAIDNSIGATKEESRDIFTKMIMKTLTALGTPKGNFKLWAETFMAELKNDDKLKDHEAAIQKIFEEFNFYEEIRARSANTPVAESFIDGASEGSAMGGGTGLNVSINGTDKLIMPTYLEYYYDVPADFKDPFIKITTTLVSAGGMDMLSGGMGGGGTPNIKLFVKKETPVIYKGSEVLLDNEILENHEKTTGNSTAYAFYFDKVEAGKRYYFQFANYGDAGGTLTNITVAGSDAPPVEVADDDVIGDSDVIDNTEGEPTDSDVSSNTENDLASDSDATTDDDEKSSNLKEKKDDGCGCSII